MFSTFIIIMAFAIFLIGCIQYDNSTVKERTLDYIRRSRELNKRVISK